MQKKAGKIYGNLLKFDLEPKKIFADGGAINFLKKKSGLKIFQK